MKLSLIAKISEDASEDAYLKAADWLTCWLEASWNIDSKYREPNTILDILKPLLSIAPFESESSNLYRVVGMDYPKDNIIIPAGYALSFTYGKGISFWKNLARAIGAEDSYAYVYVIEVYGGKSIIDMEWVRKKALPILEEKCGKQNIISKLEYFSDCYKGQKEVIAYLEKDQSAPIIRKLWGARI